MTAVAPLPLCGAHKRKSDTLCRNPAGFKTDHLGQGRCMYHGGKTPIKHGRYSTITRANIRELIEKHAADPDPLDMLPELAAARAFFEDFVNRYDEWREAILAWWQSWTLARRPWSVEHVDAMRGLVDDWEEQQRLGVELTPRQDTALALCRELLSQLAMGEIEGRPRQILDIAAAHDMLQSTTKIVERIEKIRASNAISRADLMRVMAEMGRVVEAHVKDKDQQTRITEGWLAIHVA